MRRKRRSNGSWMPVLGHTESAGDDTYAFADFIELASGNSVLPDGSLGGAQVGPFPLLPDFTLEQSSPGTDGGASLHDRVAGNAWLLQRLVGKLHIGCIPSSGANATLPAQAWSAIYVSFGVFVARSQDDAQATCDLTGKEVDPTQVDNMTNPWVFRRTWVLGNESVVSPWAFPATTAQFGSVLDGGHIDSKVKRFIQREHRLWWVLNARGWDGERLSVGNLLVTQPAFSAILDLRVFGSLRRSKNTSSF